MTYEPPESDILYLVNLNKSGITGYLDLEKPPMTYGDEVKLSASIASSDGEVLIEEFASPVLGMETLPAGNFKFYLYGSVSQLDGVSEITGHIYKRNYSGTETELFNITTGEVENTSDTVTLYEVDYSSSDYAIDITDRLVLKLYGKTDYASTLTVNLHFQGVTNQSRLFLPSPITKLTGGDMLAKIYDPDYDGYTEQSSDSGGGGGGHTIQDDGTPMTARSNLNFAYGFTVTDDAGNDATKVDVTGASASVDPWISSTDTWALSSSDDPIFVVTVDADVTALIGVGYKVKFTQDATTKYGIVHAVGEYSGGYTPLTIYGGTDYVITGNAITNPCYSYARSPIGFPMDPAKWSILVSYTAGLNVNNPTQNAWYNATNIEIPIGNWRVFYETIAYGGDATAYTWQVFVTLSTANNSESDIQFTSWIYGYSTRVQGSIHREKNLALASKTIYYLNISTVSAGLDTLVILNTYPTILKAIDNYL